MALYTCWIGRWDQSYPQVVVMGNRVEKGALGGGRRRIDCLMRFLTIYLFPIMLLCDLSVNGAICYILVSEYRAVFFMVCIVSCCMW